MDGDPIALGLGILSQLFPDDTILGLTSQAFFGTLPGPCVFLGFTPGTTSRIFRLFDLALERLDLGLERRRGIDRLGGRHKRPRLETGLLGVSSVEPNAELASQLQAGQGFGVTATNLVRRCIAELPKLMEDISDFARQDALERQATQSLLEALPFALVGPVVCGD